jgi:hypothetical protein
MNLFDRRLLSGLAVSAAVVLAPEVGFAQPTVDSVVVSNLTSLTPTISWYYTDTLGYPQFQYEVEVWTGPSGTGTCMWNPAPASGTATSVTYAGSSLAYLTTYYARVRAHNGYYWSAWAEVSWRLTPPSFVYGLNDGLPHETALTIFPENSGIRIHLDGKSMHDIKVYSLAGRCAASRLTSDNDLKIELPRGAYWVIIGGAGTHIMKRIVIVK